MALKQTELVGSVTTQSRNLRAYPYEDGIRPGTLVNQSGAPTLAHLTPLNFTPTTGKWSVFDDNSGTAQVNVITAAATTATDGTFILTIEGADTAAIAHDAAAAAIVSAITALGYTVTTDFTVADGGGGLAANNGTATITFVNTGALSGPVSITADFSGLTGNAHVLSETTPGTLGSGDAIEGFLWAPLGQATDATDDVTVQVFRRGRIHADDIPRPTGVSLSSLQAALRSQEVRKLGIEVSGLSGIG